MKRLKTFEGYKDVLAGIGMGLSTLPAMTGTKGDKHKTEISSETKKFDYAKVIILKEGSDSFGFDTKKEDTTGGTIIIDSGKIKFGKHYLRVKGMNDKIVLAVWGETTYIFCKDKDEKVFK